MENKINSIEEALKALADIQKETERVQQGIEEMFRFFNTYDQIVEDHLGERHVGTDQRGN